MFLFHILVYALFAYVMYDLGRKSLEADDDSDKIDRYLWRYILFFTLICALRGRTGVDTLSYVYNFVHGFFEGDTSLVNGEWAFYYLCDFISGNGIHYSVGLGVCAFVQIYFTIKGVLPQKYLLVYFPIVLFGSSLFLGEMNAVRQMMSAAIFFYAVRFIVDRKPAYYVVSMLAASLFHHSALMLLPLYFIPPDFGVSQKRTILLAVYVFCFILGFTPQFQGLIHYAESLMATAGYDNYVSAAAEILNVDYTAEARKFGPMQCSYFLSGLAVIWFGPELGGKYRDEIPTFNLWFLFAVAYGCLYFLVCNVSHLMIRPIMYFQLFQSLVLTLIICDLLRPKEEPAARMRVAYLLIFVIWVNIIWDIIKNCNQPFECVTYKLFFL